MKRLLSIVSLVIMSLLAGCQSMGDHFSCMAEVNRTIPAQTQQRYVRTDTKCTSSGGAIATPTTTRGDQYIVNNDGQTNCTSTPIYETIVLNQTARDAAYQQCRSNINNQRSQPLVQTSYSGAYVPASRFSNSNQAKKSTITIIRDFQACDAKASSTDKGVQIFSAILVKDLNSPNRNALIKNTNKLTDAQKNFFNGSIPNAYCYSIAQGDFESTSPAGRAINTFNVTNSKIGEDLYQQRISIGEASAKRIESLKLLETQFKSASGVAWSQISIDQQSPKPIQTSQPPKPATTTPVNTAAGSMEQGRQKCLDLGFKAGTESFGQCVLKMAK
jgi:hypothetical protein